MKITRKQEEEIDFLVGYFINENENTWEKCEARRLGLPPPNVPNFLPSESEKEEYLRHTVNGQKGQTSNKIFQAKRSLDIQIKEWRRDLASGLLFKSELEEDFAKYPYGQKLMKILIP